MTNFLTLAMNHINLKDKNPTLAGPINKVNQSKLNSVLTKSPVQSILKTLKNYLQNEYKNNLAQMILFGSQARGDASSDSDIDILIVLKNDFDYYQEIKKISPFISELCLEYNQVITCCFTTLQQWQTENSAFYRNIHTEGIVM